MAAPYKTIKEIVSNPQHWNYKKNPVKTLDLERVKATLKSKVHRKLLKQIVTTHQTEIIDYLIELFVSGKENEDFIYGLDDNENVTRQQADYLCQSEAAQRIMEKDKSWMLPWQNCSPEVILKYNKELKGRFLKNRPLSEAKKIISPEKLNYLVGSFSYISQYDDMVFLEYLIEKFSDKIGFLESIERDKIPAHEELSLKSLKILSNPINQKRWRLWLTMIPPEEVDLSLDPNSMVSYFQDRDAEVLLDLVRRSKFAQESHFWRYVRAGDEYSPIAPKFDPEEFMQNSNRFRMERFIKEKIEEFSLEHQRSLIVALLRFYSHSIEENLSEIFYRVHPSTRFAFFQKKRNKQGFPSVNFWKGISEEDRDKILHDIFILPKEEKYWSGFVDVTDKEHFNDLYFMITDEERGKYRKFFPPDTECKDNFDPRMMIYEVERLGNDLDRSKIHLCFECMNYESHEKHAVFISVKKAQFEACMDCGREYGKKV